MTIVISLLAALALSSAPDRPRVEQQWSVGPYVIESSHEPTGDIRLTFFKDGKEVYSKTAGQYWFLVPKGRTSTASKEPAAVDVTGDGVRDLVLETFPRATRCCWSYSIISLGKSVKELASIGEFTSPMTFEDVNGDGVFELTGHDSAFYSWYASPSVILGYTRGDFSLATSLMKRPAPSSSELAARAAEFRNKTLYAGFPVALEVYRYMLDLIYSGNADSAWTFLDLAWPKGQNGKQEFAARFKEQLAQSRFWPEISRMTTAATTSN